MTAALENIIDTFQSVDPDMRLEILLDFARKLPPLPERLRARRDRARIPECQTPVFLFVEAEGPNARISAEVAEESPTVAGFVSILIHAYHGAPLTTVAAAPPDLLSVLGLTSLLRMTREVGLSAIVFRLKREAARLAAPPPRTSSPS